MSNNILKFWLKSKINGRKEEYQLYKENVKLMKSDIQRYKQYIKDAQEKKYLGDGYKRWEYTLDEAKLAINFIRPNSKQDIEYREEQGDTFATKLQEVLSPDFDLRFHGTPIYFAEQIIKSGMISSSADRYDGYINSTDGRGEISVADREGIGRTINFFSDISSYQRSLPCGCIFALLPKDKEDATFGKEQSIMHSVNLRQNPQQLFGIFTSPENINEVKKWMSKAKFNPDLVYTFEEFLKVVEEKSKEVDKKNEFKIMIQDTQAEDISSNNTKELNQENQEQNSEDKIEDEDRSQ
ncbi:MAG: hypothetical protein HFJ47_03745 [Clostridia bacterium]|nr:hypothetical protein [Clostridia bacterium]